MLSYSLLDKDQLDLITRLYEYDETLVYATMGSGKTVCYLTAANELLRDGVVSRVLIVAPLKPSLHVWPKEAGNWEHLAGLKVASAVGSPAKRKAAIEGDAPVVVLNIENLPWFFDTYGRNHGFDALCIDELSKFGDSGSKSVKKLRKNCMTFKHRVGLTGTPVHEGFDKLYSQVLVLDGGARLGTSKEAFLNRYFYPTDFNRYNWELLPGGDDELLADLGDLVHSMPDYGGRPELIEECLNVTLPEEAMADYEELMYGSAIYCEGLEDFIVADNAAVLSGKLEQMANGFLYDTEGKAWPYHAAKEQRLIQFLSEAWDKENMLVFYQYQYDKERITEILNRCGVSFATLDDKQGIDKFLSGDVSVLLLHPKSAGHGLNLHTGGARQILCYSPIWSNDQFQQLVGRLWRRNAKRTVYVRSIVALDTIDEAKLERIEDKGEYDSAFKRYMGG